MAFEKYKSQGFSEFYGSPFYSTGGNEARVELVLIQPLLLSYVNNVMLNNIFKK